MTTRKIQRSLPLNPTQVNIRRTGGATVVVLEFPYRWSYYVSYASNPKPLTDRTWDPTCSPLSTRKYLSGRTPSVGNCSDPKPKPLLHLEARKDLQQHRHRRSLLPHRPQVRLDVLQARLRPPLRWGRPGRSSRVAQGSMVVFRIMSTVVRKL